MDTTDIKYRIAQTLENLSSEQLILVEKVLKEITDYFNPIKLPEVNETPSDPLAQLRNSDFIGCFEDEPDLAEKSEKIARDIITKKETYQQ